MPDSIHKHSSAPIIAGLLGILLVLETAGLGYVLTMKKSGEMNGQPAGIGQESRTGDDNVLSNIVSHVVFAPEAITYPSNDLEQGLTPIGSITRDSGPSDCFPVDVYPEDAAGGNIGELSALATNGDEAALAEAIAYGDFSSVVGYCLTRGEKYLLVSAGYNIGQLYEWTKIGSFDGNPHLVRLATVTSPYGGQFQFFPHILNGYSVIITSEGDVQDGYSWDGYLVAGQALFPLEHCSDRVGDTSDVRVLSCAYSYQP